MSVGIAIIAKNEEKNLPHLLESIDGAFDRAVLLDTGSTDNTIDLFADWAKTQEGMTYAVASWEWKNDFADARNAADRLLLFNTSEFVSIETKSPMVDWRCWADCDDVVHGARNLRNVAENADPRIVAFFAGYNYAQDPTTGKCVIHLPRERLVRNTYRHPWEGRVHEATPITEGAITSIPNDLVEWVHCKNGDAESSNVRNVEILKQWDIDEPGNTRVVGYLGTELAVQGETETAVEYFNEYLSLDSKWDQERAQIRRKLSICYMMKDKYDLAIQTAMDAVEDVPSWPDSYLTLSEAYLLGRNDPVKAAYWAQHVLNLGRPETMLIVNPLDYEFTPKKLMALALGAQNQIDAAIEYAEAALMVSPNDQQLQMELNGWRNLAKRERTAETYVMAADQLVGHDEQVKAQILLERCVPYFAMEHPKVAAKRSEVRERLLWAQPMRLDDYAEHYETGGSKPEDFIPDESIDALCEYLPRTKFLLENLKGQTNGA